MAFFDPRKRVIKLGISERYRFDNRSQIIEGEELRCTSCWFLSREPGTPSFLWTRTVQSAQPPTHQLCELCNAAAGGPET